MLHSALETVLDLRKELKTDNSRCYNASRRIPPGNGQKCQFSQLHRTMTAPGSSVIGKNRLIPPVTLGTLPVSHGGAVSRPAGYLHDSLEAPGAFQCQNKMFLSRFSIPQWDPPFKHNGDFKILDREKLKCSVP